MSRTVLVTGGAGYIGSHICKRLATEGFEPVAYDNLATGHRDAARWGPFVEGDLLDLGCLVDCIKRFAPVGVIHLGGAAYVGESVVDPEKYYLNNVAASISLLGAMRSTSLERVIFSSSCAIYGVPARLPIAETASKMPISPYGRSKLMVEQLLADYGQAYGLRHVALRYFNAAGAEPGGEISERHDPETHVIPKALMAASGKLPNFEIYGVDYPTRDGTCVRDFIHVADLAWAHCLALRYLLEGGTSIALNLGTGQGTSIREIIAAIELVTGREVPIVESAPRPGDPPELFADVRMASELLGFRPELSDIGTIVRTAAPTFGLKVVG